MHNNEILSGAARDIVMSICFWMSSKAPEPLCKHISEEVVPVKKNN